LHLAQGILLIQSIDFLNRNIRRLKNAIWWVQLENAILWLQLEMPLGSSTMASKTIWLRSLLSNDYVEFCRPQRPAGKVLGVFITAVIYIDQELYSVEVCSFNVVLRPQESTARDGRSLFALLHLHYKHLGGW